jgi:hypothetical protein
MFPARARTHKPPAAFMSRLKKVAICLCAVSTTIGLTSIADAASSKTSSGAKPVLDGRCTPKQVGRTAIVNGRKLECVKKPWVVPQWKPVAGPAGTAPKGTIR